MSGKRKQWFFSDCNCQVLQVKLNTRGKKVGIPSAVKGFRTEVITLITPVQLICWKIN